MEQKQDTNIAGKIEEDDWGNSGFDLDAEDIPF
jgi:hypothetical protein